MQRKGERMQSERGHQSEEERGYSKAKRYRQEHRDRTKGER